MIPEVADAWDSEPDVFILILEMMIMVMMTIPIKVIWHPGNGRCSTFSCLSQPLHLITCLSFTCLISFTFSI